MSFNYNHAVLVGRLTKNPEYKQLGENMNLTSFTVAVNRSYKKEDGSKEADFIPVSLWGKNADRAFEFLKKGAHVLVWGKIKVRNYEKEEQVCWITEIAAENFQILEKHDTFSEEEE